MVEDEDEDADADDGFSISRIDTCKAASLLGLVTFKDCKNRVNPMAGGCDLE
jgi:hypothetical protein